jgi:formylglycine-generating enzyme required for sulfatase activity
MPQRTRQWVVVGLLALVVGATIVVLLVVWPASVPGFPAAVGTPFRDCPDCPEMVVIPAGTAIMGSLPTDPDRTSEETPQHLIRLAQPLGVGRYPVTRAEFATYARDTVGTDSVARTWFEATDRDPAVMITWGEASDYAEWLSRRTGQHYRLPTEAEWEYAARGGTQTRYWWGDDIGRGNADCGMCRSRWDGRSTSPVGSFSPNPFGVYDMLGNVYEWVADCYWRDYSGASEDASTAFENADCGQRVLRGGSWMSNPDDVRAAARFELDPTVRQDVVGFRVVRTPSE